MYNNNKGVKQLNIYTIKILFYTNTVMNSAFFDFLKCFKCIIPENV